MFLTKFHENQLLIDGEINEKHALLVSCGLTKPSNSSLGLA